MGFKTFIYENSPVCIQNLMCSVKGWLIKRRRYNKNFLEELNKYELGVYNSEEELRYFLFKIRYLPAYSNLYNQYDIVQKLKDGCDVREVLSLFPILYNYYVINVSSKLHSYRKPLTTLFILFIILYNFI